MWSASKHFENLPHEDGDGHPKPKQITVQWPGLGQYKDWKGGGGPWTPQEAEIQRWNEKSSRKAEDWGVPKVISTGWQNHWKRVSSNSLQNLRGWQNLRDIFGFRWLPQRIANTNQKNKKQRPWQKEKKTAPQKVPWQKGIHLLQWINLFSERGWGTELGPFPAIGKQKIKIQTW